ncbi:MAG: hypothetical protein OEY94_03120 [Alphaproteobacteria bacterium]|nr:hypothetical protein [Alphaproteobacteria bacterium]
MRLVLLVFFGVVLFVSGMAQAQNEQPPPYYPNAYPNPYPQQNPNPFADPQQNPNPYPVDPQTMENSEGIYQQIPGHNRAETAEVPDGPFELCEREFGSIFLAFRDIRGDLELSFTEEDERYEYYEDYLNGLTWVLTKDNFEAHPSILCKEIIEQNGKRLKSITMFCGAKKETCDRFQKALDSGL